MRYALLALGLVLASCSSDPVPPKTDGGGTSSSGGSSSGGKDGGNTFDPQLPPTSAPAAVDAWLASGNYKQWKCEPAAKTGSPLSPHGGRRICSNDKLSGAGTTGEFPVGSATVKEIVENGKIKGYALAVKTQAGTTADTWYWYGTINGTVVGVGNGEPSCSGCHGTAGAPQDGGTARPGHDYIFTQIK